MRTKSIPRKSWVAEPYTIPKKTLLPKPIFNKATVKEAPKTNIVKYWSKVTIVATPDVILKATPPGLFVSGKTLRSTGLGVGIVFAKTSSDSAFFTFCNGSDYRQVINVQTVERSRLVAALASVGVCNKALDTYERVARAEIQDQKE